MANVLITLAVLFIVLALNTAEDCTLTKKVLKKTLKKYTKKCLNRGFISKLGCVSSDKINLRKKDLKKCSRTEKKLQMCNYRCKEVQVDGGWSDYGDWSDCSAKCGVGTQTRTRSCNSPSSANGGADCDGEASETQDCNVQACGGSGTAEACEHSGIPVSIDCGEKVIKINHAAYGVESNDNTCGLSYGGECLSRTSLQAMQDRCNGKNSCAVLASNSIFGDPCGGVYKYLTATWECTSPEVQVDGGWSDYGDLFMDIGQNTHY